MDSKKYIKESNYLSVKAVSQWDLEQRTVTILGPGEEKEFQDKETKEKQHKLQIPVMRATDKAQYEWTLSQTAIKELAADLGTYDTTKWVGATVRLAVRQSNGRETLGATVIMRPQNQ